MTPCPICNRRLPKWIEIPTWAELTAAIGLVCERNAERALNHDERRALETIRALLMEEDHAE